MDILERIDHAQQFCKFYADGAYSVEKEKWNYHVTPKFIEDIRQYIESLQLKLMHLQKQQAEPVACRFCHSEKGCWAWQCYTCGEIDDVQKPAPPPVQEPVAWGVFEGNLHDTFFTKEEAQEMAQLKGTHAEVRPLYTAPPLPVQKPVAWMRPSEEGYDSAFRDHHTIVTCTGNPWKGWLPLYTAPPAAQPEPLTHDEIEAIGDKVANEKLVGPVANFRVRFARAIEAAHNIKENT